MEAVPTFAPQPGQLQCLASTSPLLTSCHCVSLMRLFSPCPLKLPQGLACKFRALGGVLAALPHKKPHTRHSLPAQGPWSPTHSEPTLSTLLSMLALGSFEVLTGFLQSMGPAPSPLQPPGIPGWAGLGTIPGRAALREVQGTMGTQLALRERNNRDWLALRAPSLGPGNSGHFGAKWGSSRQLGWPWGCTHLAEVIAHLLSSFLATLSWLGPQETIWSVRRTTSTVCPVLALASKRQLFCGVRWCLPISVLRVLCTVGFRHHHLG